MAGVSVSDVTVQGTVQTVCHAGLQQDVNITQWGGTSSYDGLRNAYQPQTIFPAYAPKEWYPLSNAVWRVVLTFAVSFLIGLSFALSVVVPHLAR